MNKSIVTIALIATGLVCCCAGLLLGVGAACFISNSPASLPNLGQSSQEAIIGKWQCKDVGITYEFFNDRTFTASGGIQGNWTFLDDKRIKLQGKTQYQSLDVNVLEVSFSANYLTFKNQANYVFRCDKTK